MFLLLRSTLLPLSGHTPPTSFIYIIVFDVLSSPRIRQIQADLMEDYQADWFAYQCNSKSTVRLSFLPLALGGNDNLTRLLELYLFKS